jgi:hypothetical protein
MILTIKNYAKLEGIAYNSKWTFKNIHESTDRYVFVLESKHGDKTKIEVARAQCADGSWLASYNNEWFFLKTYDFETPERLIEAFRNF